MRWELRATADESSNGSKYDGGLYVKAVENAGKECSVYYAAIMSLRERNGWKVCEGLSADDVEEAGLELLSSWLCVKWIENVRCRTRSSDCNMSPSFVNYPPRKTDLP